MTDAFYFLIGTRGKRYLNLGFDIDGVIANFTQPLLEAIKENYGLNLKIKDIYTFDLNIVLGITKNEGTQLVHQTLKKDLPLNKGAKETLEKLSREGHNIYLLTGRYDVLRNITQSWLKEKGVTYTQLHMLNIGEKYMADIQPMDLIVEDSLEDALEWSQKVKNVLIYDQPWNRTLNVRNLTKRVYSWNDIYQAVQNLKNQV